MFFGGVAEVVENDAGLHAGDAAGGIDLENPRHVLGEVEDDGDVAALAGERGAAAAAEQWARRTRGRGRSWRERRRLSRGRTTPIGTWR